ncbi:MAG TPA: deoxyribodipyrimidine photo-lyase [Terracidiphilus sp.]
MQRAERGIDNHALDVAVHMANELGLPVVVFFAGINNFPYANLRHYYFLNQGLRDVEEDLAEREIGFVMRRSPHEDHLQFFHDVGAAMVIGDENPMREPERWRTLISKRLTIPFWTVDADVIVPSRMLEKAQFAARTIRPRLKRLLPDFMQPYENPKAAKSWQRPKGLLVDDVQLDMTRGWKELDRSVLPVEEFIGGTHAARKRLKMFVGSMLGSYDRERNRPEVDGTSMLSMYLHFGHIGPLTIALAIEEAVREDMSLRANADAYLDQLITWRELCVNYVLYNDKYDSLEGAEPWALKTIAEHARDERERTYTLKQLEEAKTYDELWNAAQRQMVARGWMHNYVRMYWAKKILEWTPDMKTAMQYAIHLNDKYLLDGRDPNGYGGIAWAIVGKFDRAWGERPVFGKIRYMSGASTGRKFDSRRYIAQNS